MAKFKFRFAAVQKVREARRNQERASLAEAFRAEQILAERRAELVAEEAELRLLQRSAATERYLNVNRLLEAQRYELVLKGRALELARQESALAVETERRHKLLVEADRDVRVFERLEERHRSVHQRDQQRLEIREFDEVAAQRHGSPG
jgi:flagellar export protein FliJ